MKTGAEPKRIVFCDFDGTITRQETFVALLKTYAPEKMEEFGRLFSQKKVTLREGVRAVVESIPSRYYPEMVDFIRDKEIREGFAELLVFLKAAAVPFVVISGGLKDLVTTRLAAYTDYISGIYAPCIDDSGPFLRVISDYEEGDELLSKVRVMQEFSCDQSIAVGDGVTDYNMAMNASLVFARDRLAAYLDQKQVPYVPWQDFFDVRAHLEKRIS